MAVRNDLPREMCMCYRIHMLNHRLQLLLDEDRYQRLTEEAKRRDTSVAAVIRDAIDHALPESKAERRRRAIDAILAADPMPVPDDPEDLKREIDEMYGAGIDDV